MNDPEMIFLVSSVDDNVYPMTFRQDGGIPVDQVAMEAPDGEPIRIRTKDQKDMAVFANQWMKNIKDQQGLEEGG